MIYINMNKDKGHIKSTLLTESYRGRQRGAHVTMFRLRPHEEESETLPLLHRVLILVYDKGGVEREEKNNTRL